MSSFLPVVSSPSAAVSPELVHPSSSTLTMTIHSSSPIPNSNFSILCSPLHKLKSLTPLNKPNIPEPQASSFTCWVITTLSTLLFAIQADSFISFVNNEAESHSSLYCFAQHSILSTQYFASGKTAQISQG